MHAICQNCGGIVPTKIENAKVAYCYRPSCAYTLEGEEEEMTRCNMCMTELDSEVTICPTCKVDDYLMDYKREGEDE